MMAMDKRKKKIMHRKNEFADAAQHLFYTRRYEKTTIEEIADFAGYTKMTLYSYFQSKDEIYIVVFIRSLVERVKYIEKGLLSGNNGYQQLKNIAHKYFEFYSERPEQLKFFQSWQKWTVDESKISNSILEKYREINLQGIDYIRKAIVNGINDGSLCPDLEVDKIVSYFLYSSRAVLSEYFFSTHQFHKFTEPDYYYDYISLFLKAISS
ncbi:MAG: TetR/AcrR family transcriptional regulator [bacterium]